jgi:glycosyltransferase involved in cell wall biosynthesis
VDKPSILWLVSNGFDACLLWRTWWIVKALRAKGYTADWRYFKRFNDQLKPAIQSGKYNIVVTPRYSLKEEWMTDYFDRLVHSSGMKWVFETDDDLFSDEVLRRQTEFFFALLPGAERAGVKWELEWERNERIRSLSLIDGIITTTSALANVISSYTTKPIYVAPNGMDIEWFKARMAERPRWIEPLTIGWSGGWRGIEDVAPVAAAWATVARERPAVRFVTYSDDFMAAEFAKVLPQGRLTPIPWSKLTKYPSGLKNIDIACCSVAPSEWNACKTPIKWMEASIAGSACVVSASLYGDAVIDGTNALVATTPDEWAAQIIRLVDDPVLRKSQTFYARQTVLWKHSVHRTVEKWEEAFYSILNPTWANPSSSLVTSLNLA